MLFFLKKIKPLQKLTEALFPYRESQNYHSSSDIFFFIGFLFLVVVLETGIK